MAGDWIKLRSALARHPKVVRIASALIADTERTGVLLQSKRAAITLTVGGLARMFSVFDEQSVDGRLEGYGCTDLDDEVGVPGFAAQVIAIGWLQDDGIALTMPEFSTHNGASAKRRAQDADRKRAERALQGDGVRELSAGDADTTRTRKEKRRKDSVGGEPPTTPGAGAPGGEAADQEGGRPGKAKPAIEMADKALVLPEWLRSHAEAFSAFEANRWAMHSKAPYTSSAQKGIVAKLQKLQDEGHDLTEVLNASVRNSWRDVFAPRGGRRATTPPGGSFSGRDYSGGELEHGFDR